MKLGTAFEHRQRIARALELTYEDATGRYELLAAGPQQADRAESVFS